MKASELIKNDLFLMRWENEIKKFRVVYSYSDCVYAHSLDWDKSHLIKVTEKELNETHYIGRMSKLRAFLLF
jgi:hypothetical protein